MYVIMEGIEVKKNKLNDICRNVDEGTKLNFKDISLSGDCKPKKRENIQENNIILSAKMNKELQPVAYITRIEKFSACHRLHSVHLSDDENLNTFGKCNNPNGHGHNYKLEVTVKGGVDSRTGMVMNITDLKNIIKDVVMDTMDHKHLDKDVAIFRDKNIVTTTENVAVIIFKGIKDCLPNGVTLYEIKLHETDKNIVVFRGEFI